LSIDAIPNKDGSINEPISLVCRDCLMHEVLDSIGEGFGE